MKVNILDIIKGTTVDGPGFRTSVYFAGCKHSCKDCHNPSSWDFKGGIPYSIDDLLQIIIEEDFDVTLSGGDPLYQPEFVSELVNKIKNAGHNVWIYTGFLWKEIINSRILLNAVRNAEVVVDGPFISELKEKDLIFKGSSNQRLINVSKSLELNNIVLYKYSNL